MLKYIKQQLPYISVYKTTLEEETVADSAVETVQEGISSSLSFEHIDDDNSMPPLIKAVVYEKQDINLRQEADENIPDDRVLHELLLSQDKFTSNIENDSYKESEDALSNLWKFPPELFLKEEEPEDLLSNAWDIPEEFFNEEGVTDMIEDDTAFDPQNVKILPDKHDESFVQSSVVIDYGGRVIDSVPTQEPFHMEPTTDGGRVIDSVPTKDPLHVEPRTDGDRVIDSVPTQEPLHVEPATMVSPGNGVHDDIMLKECRVILCDVNKCIRTDYELECPTEMIITSNTLSQDIYLKDSSTSEAAAINEPETVSKSLSKESHPSAGNALSGGKRKKGIITFSKDKVIYCNKCMASFSRKKSLKKHYTLHHTLGTPFKCKICNIPFGIFSKFLIHMKKHGNTKYFCCAECYDVLYSKSTLLKHMEKEHGSICPMVCEVCYKGFSFASDKSSHTCILNSFTYRCRKCFVSFKKDYIFEAHILKCLFNIQCHICDVCGRGFTLPLHLKRHKMFHRDKKLNSCKLRPAVKKGAHSIINNAETLFEFVSTNSLCPAVKKGPESNKNKSESLTDCGTNVKSFVCKLCPESFDVCGSLKEHEIAMHKKGGSFKCNICSKVFLSEKSLKQHSQFHSMDSDKANSFPCETCGEVFQRRKLLERHVLVHSKIKSFKCQFCPAVYKRQERLSRHESDSHGEGMSYGCPFCQKLFYTKASLNMHLLSHSSQKL